MAVSDSLVTVGHLFHAKRVVSIPNAKQEIRTVELRI